MSHPCRRTHQPAVPLSGPCSSPFTVTPSSRGIRYDVVYSEAPDNSMALMTIEFFIIIIIILIFIYVALAGVA